jgi:hypothetical protein
LFGFNSFLFQIWDLVWVLVFQLREGNGFGFGFFYEFSSQTNFGSWLNNPKFQVIFGYGFNIQNIKMDNAKKLITLGYLMPRA